MLKILLTMFKYFIFAIIVLVLGNMIQWKGVTLSDKVRSSMSHAEQTPLVQQCKSWTANLVANSKTELRNKFGARTPAEAGKGNETTTQENSKLHAVLKDINSNDASDVTVKDSANDAQEDVNSDPEPETE